MTQENETRQQRIQRALAALAFVNSVGERLAARRALAEEQRAQESKAFTERRAQDVLTALETPAERWARIKARALRNIARANATIAAAAKEKRKREGSLTPLVQRLNNARTPTQRRAVRMAILAELRKDNPSTQGTVYKTRQDAATPAEQFKNARTPEEYREALAAMARLADLRKRGLSD